MKTSLKAATSVMLQEDRFVCVNCFEDSGLANFISEKAVATSCSFCPSQAQDPIAAPMDDVSAYFLKCLYQEYDLAVKLLGWISSGEGWYGTSWSSEELVTDVIGLEFPQHNQDQLLPFLLDADFDQDWCEENAYGLNAQDMVKYSWDHFCRVIMHRRRFFFLGRVPGTRDSEVYSPGEMLHTIFEYAQKMGLFKTIPSGAQLFRARWEGCEPTWEKAEELGPPPMELAIQANRMSPAGIPMFYGCDDEVTALKETESCPGFYAIGRFETLRSLTLLDLSTIPPIPGLFDSLPGSEEISPRQTLTFLDHVAREISRPIERDNRVHIEYVPTQVVTEFVRSQLTWNGSCVDGIKYDSSARPGHPSYVLFANQDNVLSSPESERSNDIWLKLTGTKHTWVNGKQMNQPI